MLYYFYKKFQNQMNSETSQGELDQTPFEVLKTKVYPVINDVILKVTIHLL